VAAVLPVVPQVREVSARDRAQPLIPPAHPTMRVPVPQRPGFRLRDGTASWPETEGTVPCFGTAP